MGPLHYSMGFACFVVDPLLSSVGFSLPPSLFYGFVLVFKWIPLHTFIGFPLAFLMHPLHASVGFSFVFYWVPLVLLWAPFIILLVFACFVMDRR